MAALLLLVAGRSIWEDILGHSSLHLWKITSNCSAEKFYYIYPKYYTI